MKLGFGSAEAMHTQLGHWGPKLDNLRQPRSLGVGAVYDCTD
jgi:hypothetical protein